MGKAEQVLVPSWRSGMAETGAPDDPDVDPTGPCCGIFDPPTRFEEREKVRIANRSAAEIQKELLMTAKKLGLFILWFYATLYISCLVFALALDVTFKAAMPFEANSLDWDSDEGIAIGAGTLSGFILTVPAVAVIVREGASREYDTTLDFCFSIGLLHFTLTCLVKLEFPTEVLWWATEVGGLFMLLVVGWYTCTRYWNMKGLERLVGKVGKMNTSQPEDKVGSEASPNLTNIQ